MSKSDFRDIGRQAIARAGFFWHVNFKSLHFQKIAFERYGYKARSKKWEAKKQREHPEAEGRPLVFTGESERAAMGANKVDANATTFDKYYADCIVAQSTLNFHADEMTAVTQEEVDSLAAVFADEFQAGMVERAQQRGATSGQVALWETALDREAA